MAASKSIHEAMLKQAAELLKRWKECEADENTDDEAFSDKWAELSEDVSAFLELCRDVGASP